MILIVGFEFGSGFAVLVFGIGRLFCRERWDLNIDLWNLVMNHDKMVST